MVEHADNGMMTWQKWHNEWSRFKAEQEARDQEQRDVLAEARDAIQATHIMFERLPCEDEKRLREQLARDIAAIQADVACVRRNAIPWQALIRMVNGKMLLGAIGLVAGWLGWEKAGKALADLAK